MWPWLFKSIRGWVITPWGHIPNLTFCAKGGIQMNLLTSEPVPNSTKPSKASSLEPQLVSSP